MEGCNSRHSQAMGLTRRTWGEIEPLNAFRDKSKLHLNSLNLLTISLRDLVSFATYFLCYIELTYKLSDSPFFYFKMDLLLKLSVLGWVPRSRYWGECLCKSDFCHFPGDSVVKNPPANAGNLCLIPELGRSPGGGNGNPLQYVLGNPMVRGAWRAADHRVAKSETHVGTQQLNSSSSPRKTWQGSGEGGKERKSDPHKLAIYQ